jgi:ubiquinone biosynthesis protein
MTAATYSERSEKGSTLGRAFEIFFRASTFLAWLVVRRMGFARKVSPARRFADTLQGLGTSFVKLGQHLSLRSDLFPPDYLEELQKLQDRVRPFPGEMAAAQVERAFGKPLSELFVSFEREPLAAASVAQVHAARTFEGADVVVKVLRPGVGPQVDRDMRMFALVVRILSHFSPLLARYRAEAVVREVWASLRRELDLREEARAVHRFAGEFREWSSVEVPDIVPGLSSATVMVMQRTHGQRVDNAGSTAGHALAQALIDAYVHMFFVMGFFHGDPHPGNLLVTGEGKLALHDFGVVGSLDRPTRHALASFVLAFTEQDTEWVLDSWLELGMLQKSADRARLRPVVAALMAEYSRRPIGEWSIGDAFSQLVTASRNYNFGVPLHLLVLGRTLILIEATVRLLDPAFSLLDCLAQRSSEVMQTALGSEHQRTRRLQYEAAIASTEWQRLLASGLRRLREEGMRLRVEHEGLPELSQQIAVGAGRVSLALVTLGLYLAGSVLMQYDSGPSVLDFPALAAIFYLFALWFTVRLVRSIGRHF